MKLQSARVRNFKLLRNIDLSFSTRQDVPLTVIRAENGSGKNFCPTSTSMGFIRNEGA